MGNNQSVSSSLLDLNIVSYGNDSASSLNSSLQSSMEDTSSNSNTGFVADNSEEYLAQVIHQIMAKDEVLAIIRRSIGEPVQKKAKKVRRPKRRCTTESLQQSVWGQMMLAIQEEIAENGSLPQSDLQNASVTLR